MSSEDRPAWYKSVWLNSGRNDAGSPHMCDGWNEIEGVVSPSRKYSTQIRSILIAAPVSQKW